MSAYVVSDSTINAIVTYAGRHSILRTNGAEQETAAMLYAENVRSVNFRYAHIGDDQSDEGFVFKFTGEFKPIEIIKLINCLEYQSCETNDWEATPACKLLRAISHAALRKVPGYDAAPWGLED